MDPKSKKGLTPMRIGFDILAMQYEFILPFLIGER
ncbi:hypothetical protein Q31b_39900 [Novipirellula aureliae]|uniref:Uncharacterized protein n=1 Tax=Novipirellula aureliae TaxID=2527966 RepID=A0A5C6DQK7_9BACT|nr:hypothetical protein Q31b_39900 [Novipirellula aureliae]